VRKPKAFLFDEPCRISFQDAVQMRAEISKLQNG
jgi:ABC-type sugar transport system ATPase subunit